MVGKLQDVLTASAVGSAGYVKDAGGGNSGGMKVNKVNEFEALFERDNEYNPFDEKNRLEPGTFDEELVGLVTEAFNELMSRINCDLEFQYHKEVNMMSIKMVDKKTNEVIKEVPPEEMIENIVRARDWIGAFIDRNM